MSDNKELIGDMRRAGYHTVADALEKADARIAVLEAEADPQALHASYLHGLAKGREENAALAAIVKQQRGALIIAESHIAVFGGTPDPEDPYANKLQINVQRWMREALALDTATAENVLAEYRREVVEECAKVVRDKICFKFATGSPSRDIAQAALEDIRALIAAPAPAYTPKETP